jgi:phosphoglycerate dehydrogenase-like enzyme
METLGWSNREVFMLCIAVVGTFAASLEQPLRRHLAIPCDIVVADEAGIVSLLGDVDVLVSMALTAEMGRQAVRLKLVQVPGAGLDRIDRAACRMARCWPMSTAMKPVSPST